MAFQPRFTITTTTAAALMRIEAARQAIEDLPITPSLLRRLRETARLQSTHYSTRIEGNRLTQHEVSQVLREKRHFPGRDRDEHEVLGYYAALEVMEQWAADSSPLIEGQILRLHALVMGGGRKTASPTRYRDGQNVIRDSRTRRIVYLPPEAKDVPALMADLVSWIETSRSAGIPCPLRAAIAHYQFATIHPYYDGNGRTARLLAGMILHRGGYGLKGVYSLEEYYALDLAAYYAGLTVGPTHNYYDGRAQADISAWLEYFCQGVADSFESIRARALVEAGEGRPDASARLRRLDPRQRKVLTLLDTNETITSRDIVDLFAVSQRTARKLCQDWVRSGFLRAVDPAKKTRRYALVARAG